MKGDSSRCVDSFYNSVHLVDYMRSECCQVEVKRLSCCCKTKAESRVPF